MGYPSSNPRDKNISRASTALVQTLLRLCVKPDKPVSSGAEAIEVKSANFSRFDSVELAADDLNTKIFKCPEGSSSRILHSFDW
jgi:hypothetical protein